VYAASLDAASLAAAQKWAITRLGTHSVSWHILPMTFTELLAKFPDEAPDVLEPDVDFRCFDRAHT